MILQWPADAKLLEVVPKGPRATREGHEKKDESRKPESTKLFVKKLKCIGLSIISPSLVDLKASENMF